MTLTAESARLLLFMLGKGASRIRPGEYTAEQTLEMENRLREVADEAEWIKRVTPESVSGTAQEVIRWCVCQVMESEK